MSDIDFKSTKKYIEAMQARNWQQCDLIADEHKALVEIINQLEQENAKLKERLKDAENSMKFYANKDSVGYNTRVAREYFEKWGSDE